MAKKPLTQKDLNDAIKMYAGMFPAGSNEAKYFNNLEAPPTTLVFILLQNLTNSYLLVSLYLLPRFILKLEKPITETNSLS